MSCYNGLVVGPIIRNHRIERHLTIDEMSERMGISSSTVAQVEQGGRGLSMKMLFKCIDLFGTDANTILNIHTNKDSIDALLDTLPAEQKKYFVDVFKMMINNANNLVA